ncbi:MAG: hypothetical protein GX590_03525, partial [Lentisphaerae bacterium]|nr:hypothetical protein [Lentisphaerota bacterium]
MVDGSLTANGGVYGGSADGCGSGSGGGIYVTCQTFGGAASGLLSVKGGDNTGARGGAGGGGRIAVDYETLAPGNAVRFNAQSGSGYYTQPRRAAAPGTLWLATRDLLQAGTIGDGRFMGVCFHAPGFDAWTVDELVVTNGAVILAADGFTLNVQGDLTVGDGGLLGIGAVSGDAHPALNCDGSLRVRDGGCLLVFGGRTNSAAKAVGAEVTVAG